MLRTIVIEDEELIRKMIVNMVKNIPIVNFIGDAGSVTEGVILANTTKPDLILLDVQLQDGTGFNLIERLKTKTKIIFITAYDEYAIKAIKVGALDYILKPIDEEELENTIQKIYAENEQKAENIEGIAAINTNLNKLLLRTQEGLHVIDIDEIMYCQGEGSYTLFFLKDAKKITVSKPLKDYETILPNKRFARCHQSYIVNLKEIIRIDKSDIIIMKDKTEIPISSRKKKWFLDSFFPS